MRRELAHLLFAIGDSLWRRFLMLGILGKAIAVAAVLFAIGYAAASIGLEALSENATDGAWLIVSLLLALGALRVIWQSAVGRR